MGQKTHPTGNRLGIIKTWESRWFATRQTYSDQLYEDVKLKKVVKERLFRVSLGDARGEGS